jgi:hypothetical protein
VASMQPTGQVAVFSGSSNSAGIKATAASKVQTRSSGSSEASVSAPQNVMGLETPVNGLTGSESPANTVGPDTPASALTGPEFPASTVGPDTPASALTGPESPASTVGPDTPASTVGPDTPASVLPIMPALSSSLPGKATPLSSLQGPKSARPLSTSKKSASAVQPFSMSASVGATAFPTASVRASADGDVSKVPDINRELGFLG